MTYARGQIGNERAGGAVAALAVHGLIAALLMVGIGPPQVPPADSPLKLFDVVPPPPPPEPERVAQPPRPAEPAADPDRDPGRTGAGAPPNLRGRATPIVAPEPIVPLPLPTPVVAAPAPDTGSAPSTGRADVPGPGTGAGGYGGNGYGAGGQGDGGGGGGFGRGTPPRHIRGRLGNSDYPAGLGEAGIGGLVSVRFTVTLDGRATNCRITRSSGSAQLDAHTCRLIEQRYRFRPSLDERGRPVEADVIEDHEWIVRDLPPPRR